MSMDIYGVIRAAAPLGGGIALVMVALAVLAMVLRDRSRERRHAIERAAPGDLPTIVGDEVDKLGLGQAVHGLPVCRRMPPLS